jgi:hypothetical protein
MSAGLKLEKFKPLSRQGEGFGEWEALPLASSPVPP